MTNTQGGSAVLDNDSDILEDPSGLVEIQKALEEIEKLKSEEEPTESEPVEEESAEEESAEEEVLPEEETKDLDNETPKEGSKKLDKVWKIKRSRYKALAEKREALEENARLKKMLAESLDSGTYHYSKTTYAELEKAKDFKKKTIEEGDVDGLIEADILLNKATYNVNELEKWQSSSAQEPKIDNNPINESHNETEQAMATDWLDNHTYLQPNSVDYNKELAGEVSQFINYLDENLANNNQSDEYFSEQYFDVIDKYIGEAQHRIDDKLKTPKAAKNLESADHIGSVRNSYSSSSSSNSPSSKKLILTADERRMCANAGITEKDWLRYKLEDLKKGK